VGFLASSQAAQFLVLTTFIKLELLKNPSSDYPSSLTSPPYLKSLVFTVFFVMISAFFVGNLSLMKYLRLHRALRQAPKAETTDKEQMDILTRND
jgi:NhaP-type Na+/H+ or K+/H+ antiporter